MSERLMYLSIVKRASGYHYKDLHVTSMGPIESCKLIHRDAVVEQQTPRNGRSIHIDNSLYLVKLVNGFTLYTRMDSNLQHLMEFRPFHSYRMLQLSTPKGEVFYTIVTVKRLASIILKSRVAMQTNGIMFVPPMT